MEAKEINDVISLMVDATLSIAGGLLLDKKGLEYNIKAIKDKEVREHVEDVLNNLFTMAKKD